MFTRRIFMGSVTGAVTGAVTGVALAGLSLPALAQSVPDDISGTYRAEGRNPDGSSYTGTATVQESAGGAVAVAWIVANQSYAGVGTREGRVVSVNWGANDPVVYVIMPNGALHGTWDNGRALERLIK